MTYAFCEPVMDLLAFEPIHLRQLRPGEQLQTHGFSHGSATLCKRVPYYGWDVPGDVTETTIDARLNFAMPMCSECAEEWARRHGGKRTVPAQSVQGVRSHLLVTDEISELPDPF